jgi:hypothetical protein
MRMAFGLVGILGGLVALVFILSHTLPGTEQNLKTARQAKDTARQVAGYDESGVKASETIKLAEETSGGKLTGVLVTSITQGGAMEKHFGLKRNDSIVQIGPLTMDEIGSAQSAKDYLVDAFQRSQPIVIVRNERRMTLPLTPAPAPAAGTSTNAPAKPAETSKDPLQRQLDAIPGVR